MVFVKRFAGLIVAIAPTLLLALGVVLAAVATIVLDHDILGRDAEGWPVLYKTPSLRHAVDAFHFGIMYLLPPALAIAFLALGRKLGARTAWILIGGILVSTLGGIHVIEAAWTGIKGTSGLHIGFVDDGFVAATRLLVNFALYIGAFFYFESRSRKMSV